MVPRRHYGTWSIAAFILIGTSPAFGAPKPDADRKQQQARRRTPVVEVFESSKSAVVNISTTQIVTIRPSIGFNSLLGDFFDLPAARPRQFKRTSVGSGFVLHESGYIVTNAHVVARTAERKVIFEDKSEFYATIVALDEEHDLAVLKINPPKSIQSIKLGRSDDLMVGETVVAIGNSMGFGHTVTAGVVSALDRTLDMGRNVKFENLIQTDASINPGNSGGPLLNVLGELVGINTAIRTNANNIGFAIPVDQLRKILPEMLDVERRYRIVIGLSVAKQGPAVITKVQPDSPAAKAGLRSDDVVIRLDKQQINNAIEFHIALIGRKPGQTVRIIAKRKNLELVVPITFGQRPRPDGAKLLTQRIGVTAKPISPSVAKQYGLRPESGLMITAVEPRSPAANIRLKAGDILIGLGRFETRTLDDVGQLLEKVKSGKVVRITLLRLGPKTLYRLSVHLEAR